MTAEQDQQPQIETRPNEVRRWLDSFLESTGVEIQEVADDAPVHSVVVHDIQVTTGLLLDVGAVPFATSGEADDRTVTLSHVTGNYRVTTEPLQLSDVHTDDGRILARVAYPGTLQLEIRRHEFRAKLRQELHCRVSIAAPDLPRPLVGELVDLSLSGCKVRLPARAVHVADRAPRDCQLTLAFPSGEEQTLDASLRHFDPEIEQGNIAAGVRFGAMSSAVERRVWHYVCEIEREAARSVDSGRELEPSGLFLAAVGSSATSGSGADNSTEPHETVAARQLAAVGNGLGLLFMDFRSREALNSSLLSRLSDNVLSLLEADRQELLFALACIPEQPPLIRHSLAVAARLADISRCLGMGIPQVKAVTACALVHEFGYALGAGMHENPETVPRSEPKQLRLIVHALGQCGWLTEKIIAEMVEQVHERLDGGGHPRGLAGEAIGALGRLAAVVDALEMRCGSTATSAQQSYAEAGRALLAAPEAYEAQWVEFFFTTFGQYPVGSRVTAPSGERYWVRRVNDDGGVAEVLPASGSPTPRVRGADPLSGDALVVLGELR